MAERTALTDPTQLITVGWRELVAFPDWGIGRIRAKIDTGARTSAIHVREIEILPDERVRFEIVSQERPVQQIRWVEAPLVRQTVVKPSSGKRQRRIVCAATIQLGPYVRDIEVSLVCRKGMLCRMLVGRRALAGQFVVDPQQKYVLSTPAKPRRRRKGSLT